MKDINLNENRNITTTSRYTLEGLQVRRLSGYFNIYIYILYFDHRSDIIQPLRYVNNKQTIESQYGSSEFIFIEIYGKLYQINFADLKQVNTLTGGKRKLRRVPLNHKDNSKQTSSNRSRGGSYSGGHSNNRGGYKSSSYYGGSDRGRGRGSGSYRGGGRGRGRGRGRGGYNNNNYNHGGGNNVDDNHSNYSPNNNSSAMWQVFLGGSWKDYDPGTSKFIESKFQQNNQGVFDCMIRGNKYHIDLINMTQANASTSYK